MTSRKNQLTNVVIYNIREGSNFQVADLFLGVMFLTFIQLVHSFKNTSILRIISSANHDIWYKRTVFANDNKKTVR